MKQNYKHAFDQIFVHKFVHKGCFNDYKRDTSQSNIVVQKIVLLYCIQMRDAVDRSKTEHNPIEKQMHEKMVKSNIFFQQ